MQPTQLTGTIKCIPFHTSLKEYVTNEVIKKNNYLSKNYSYEGGFEMPLTLYWKNNVELNNREFLKYHNARQLRFVSDNEMIIGLRLKDGINYMTDYEINEVINTINKLFV